MSAKQAPPWRCAGIVGWLRGHDFMKSFQVRPNPYCYRCGMPAGGWITGLDTLEIGEAVLRNTREQDRTP